MKNNNIKNNIKNTLDNIPRSKPDAKEITGLVKENGRVTGYELSDGSVVDRSDGVKMAKNGEISGVGVAHNGDTEYLKSIPNGSEKDNLGNLPTV